MANTTIKYLQGARFTPTEVESTTIDTPYELPEKLQKVAKFMNETGGNWLLKASTPEPCWFGWLPRNEFHVECVGKKFIEKVLR